MIVRGARLDPAIPTQIGDRFLSGADCSWTTIDKSNALYCRRNGRAFRIARGKDKRWTLYRISDVEDDGDMLGTYQDRRDANKALEKIAYAPEAQRLRVRPVGRD